MEFLEPLLQRPVIVGLAIAGAVVATIGSVLLRKGSTADPKVGKFVLRTGYGIAWVSVGLFIVAGFIAK